MLVGVGFDIRNASLIVSLALKSAQIVICVLVVRIWLGQRVTSTLHIKGLSLRSGLIAVALFVATLWAVKTGGNLVSLYRVHHADSGPANQLSPTPIEGLLARPLWFLIAASLINGVAEEMVFRGCTIEMVEVLTANAFLAGLVSFVLDSAVHVPFWGGLNTMGISLSLLPYVVVYMRFRNLSVCIWAHAASDGFLSLAPRLLGPELLGKLWSYL